MNTTTTQLPYSNGLKKHTLFLLLVILVFGFKLKAQTSANDFGISTGSLTSGTSIAIIPAPPLSGSSYAHVGVSGGAIYLQNPGLNSFGCATELRASASSTSAVSKLTPISDYTSSQEAYVKFNVLFGNSTGISSVTSGEWSMYVGDGSMYQDTNDFTDAQVFSGLKFVYGSSGAISTQYRNGSSWSSFSGGLSQGNNFTVELMLNNTASTISYTYGSAQAIAANTFDIWVNGVLVGNDLSKAGLSSLASINDICFIGQNSVSNDAHIFLDNVEVSNIIPAFITRPSIAISAMPVFPMVEV
jgi:hypothetical protein